MTRASDTARLLGAGATILDGTTITTADNTTQLTLTSTDADATNGPNLDLIRDSSSPADGDNLGRVRFYADNDANESTIFTQIYAGIEDASDGSEDGHLKINTIVAGTGRNRLSIIPSETVFNEDSVDVDFRVESNGNANMLFIEGSTDRIGINTSSPATDLHVRGADDTDTFTVGNTTENTQLRIRTLQDDRAVIAVTDGGTNRNLSFETGTTERMRLSSGGNFMVGNSNTTPAQSNIAGAFSIRPSAQLEMSANNTQAAFFNRTTDGTLIQFLHEGSSEGNIGISGSTVSFNGGHLARYSRLTNDKKDISIVKGTVMTNLDEMVVWSHKDTLWTEEDEPPKGVSVGDVKKPAYTEDNEQLNKMAVSSVEGDINVAGVFVSWDNDDDFNDMVVAMTGDMVIRIAKGTTVARGDLLMSAGDGTAKSQGDDIVKSKTIAKVTSINISHTYDDGTYLVPCVLMAC